MIYILFGFFAPFLVNGIKCGQSEYLSGSGECCPMCKIGFMVLRDCVGNAITTCKPCIHGTYMNEPNGLNNCFNCKICDHSKGLSVLQACTTIQNTVCGILDGYYCMDYADGECTFALKHSKCQPGQRIKVPGTKTTDTVCEACPSGFYSPLGVNCTKWTVCSDKDEYMDKKGSSVEDVRCIKGRRERYMLIASFILLGLVFLFLMFGLKSKCVSEESKQPHNDKCTEDKPKIPEEETRPSTSIQEENIER